MFGLGTQMTFIIGFSVALFAIALIIRLITSHSIRKNGFKDNGLDFEGENYQKNFWWIDTIGHHD